MKSFSMFSCVDRKCNVRFLQMLQCSFLNCLLTTIEKKNYMPDVCCYLRQILRTVHVHTMYFKSDEVGQRSLLFFLYPKCLCIYIYIIIFLFSVITCSQTSVYICCCL